MNVDGLTVRADGAVDVSGVLSFETVPVFLGGETNWLDTGGGPLTVDLKAVSRADSAGLALMLEWLRRTRAAGRELHFVNVPEQVRHLIEVSGLTEVFVLK